MFSISSEEKLAFAKNLSIMLKSGITLSEALRSLSEQTISKKFKRIIDDIQENTSKGISLADALTRHSTVFGGVFIALIRAGEASGTLDENLIFLAQWLEREYDLSKEIRAATLYPKIILGVTILLIVFLTIFILPRLTPLFSDLGTQPPLITRLLIAATEGIMRFWYLIIAGLFLLVTSWFFIKTLSPIRRILDYLSLRAPFFGALAIDHQLALISQLFFTCFKSSLTLEAILEMVSRAITNTSYQESCTAMQRRVEQGIPLSQAMTDFKRLYPRQYITIIATGEKSGTLTTSFNYLAEFYSKEVLTKARKIPVVIEPLLLLFIAFVVGFIALSIILPLYQLTLSVGG